MDLGELNIPFIYKGSELVHPSPIKDGLVLWYDFSGMNNSFENRGIATDLSGNENHGTLQNFSYSEGSGYDKRGLLFDGVDDVGETLEYKDIENFSFDVTYTIHEIPDVLKGTFGRGSFNNYGFTLGYRVSRGTPIITLVTNTEVQHTIDIIKNYEVGKKYNISIVFENYNDKKNDLRIYVNGELKNSSISRNLIPENLNFLYFGKGQWHEGNQTLHSAKVYNRPLTAEEIVHNYEIEKERFGIGGSEL